MEMIDYKSSTGGENSNNETIKIEPNDSSQNLISNSYYKEDKKANTKCNIDTTQKYLINLSNGDTYEGYFNSDGLKHGQGTYIWSNGEKYVGNFNLNSIEGEGKYYWPNGDIYEGEFYNGKREGKGKFYYNDGDIFEGEWVNDIKEGEGKLIYKSGTIFEGIWKNDKREGKGKFYNAQLDVEYIEGLLMKVRMNK